MDEIRKAFEAFIDDNTSWSIGKRQDGSYREYGTHCAWLAFQAGRAAGFAEAREAAANESEKIHDRIRIPEARLYLWDVRQAIRALGPK